MANVDTRSKQKGRISPSLVNYYERLHRNGLCGFVQASAEEHGYIATPLHPVEVVFRPITGDQGGEGGQAEPSGRARVDVGLDDELAELVSGNVSDSDDESRLSPSILNAAPPRRPVVRALAQPHRAGSTSRGHMTTASCKRASRMARPSEPSTELLDSGFEAIVEKERQLTREGWTRIQGDPDEERWKLDHGLDAAPTGKGSAVPAAAGGARSETGQQSAAQSRVNHIASVKSKTVDTGTHEPAWLINMNAPCGQMYGRLAATAIKSNAVNSSVTKREKTQGAANQTSRINCKIISQAAAAQVDAVAIALARARAMARHQCPYTASDKGLPQLEYTVANPMATNAADPSMLWKVKPDCISTEEAFVVTMSSKLLFNANPCKIGKASVMEVARQLAHAELDDCAISERMGGFNHMLEGVCLAIVNPSEYEIDPVWASWVLIVYMTCHPEGRKLLSATNLTDVDYQTASTFESYGRAEVTRRARLEASQSNGRKRAKRGEPQAPPSVSPGMPEMQGLSLQEQPDAGPTGTPHSAWSSTQATADAADADGTVGAVGDEETQVSALEQMAEEDRKTLATKRKRGAKGCASASTSDSSGMIQWWFAALRGENASVLMSLMAHTTSAAKEAAGQTLTKQADGIAGVAESSVLRGMSEENAVKCVKALAPFAHRRVEEIPTVVAWYWKGKQYRGIVRTRNEASSTTCHACHIAPGVVQPGEGTSLRVAWSVASMQFTPSDEYRMAVPSIMEQLQSIQSLKATGKRGEVRAERLSEFVKLQTQLPRPTAMAGVTRSTISCAIRLAVSQSVAEAGNAVAGEMTNLFGEGSHGEQPVGFEDAVEDAPTDSLAKVLRISRHAEGRPEPLCAPATRLALGIVMNEELRSWMAGKTRKNDPCKVVLGHVSSCGDVPAIIDAEPPPLLTIVDYHLEQTEAPEGPGQADDVQFGLALHVCGDGAVRVPEMLVALYHETLLSTPGVASVEKKAEFVSMARATVWAASSQASYISNVGPVISAGFANTAISSSKKIAVADNHRLPLLSAFDTYAAGLANLEPSHMGTPYAGTYGCPLDHGISPPGHMAHNYRSDKRQHGNMCLSEEMADRLAPRFVDSHWIPMPGFEKRFCEAPATTRGVPHNLVPGIHACLDEYVEALETLRKHTGREDSATVDSLLVLPFSPWSQALAPTVETTADLSMRLCVRDSASLSVSTGQAYLPDCTHPSKAIVQEPLFRRPCQASLSDNPFATSYEYMDSFFNLANGIVLMGRVAMMEHPSRHEEPLSMALARRVDTWVHSPPDSAEEPLSSAICADVLLMLSMMYPLNYTVGDSIVLSPWAAAVPALQRKLAAGEHTGLGFRSLGLSEELVTEGRAWWSVFCRGGNGIWARGPGLPLGPLGVLLDLLDKQDGSHDVTLERYAQVRTALNDSVRAAWLVASPDGVQPPPDGHPASRARAPEKVRGPMVDPVFVGDENRGVEQRGCLVGLKPHQMRQVCALAMGANLEDVVCNVKRNEGGLSLRVSSAPDILDEKGNERSSKSISPVQTEADEQAFGSRADKLRGCKLQRSAWDGNAELLTPLFTAIRAPLPRERLTRGAPRGASYMQQRAAALRKRDQMKTITEEVEAQKLFEEAVVSGVARASREALAHGKGS